MTLTCMWPWPGPCLRRALLQLSSHASLTCYELSHRSLHLCGIMGERCSCTEAEQGVCSDRGVHLGAGGDWTGDIVPSRAADAILTASLLRAGNNNSFVPNIVYSSSLSKCKMFVSVSGCALTLTPFEFEYSLNHFQMPSPLLLKFAVNYLVSLKNKMWLNK